MPCLCFAVFVFAGAAAGSTPPEPVPLLEAALADYATGEGRWAYVQHTVERNRRGNPKSDRLVRVDPSLPWDERQVLVEVDGRAPTVREQRDYQAEREKDRRRAERRGSPPRPRLRDALQISAATVVEQREDVVILEVPLEPDASPDLPPDKLRVLITIQREPARLRAAEVHLREAVRKAGVARIKAVEMHFEFTAADAAGRPPALRTLEASGSASVLFVPVGGSVQVTRTDHRWVKPYDERFDVQIGESTAVDF